MTAHIPRIVRLCSACGVEISQERLLAVPHTEYCISCRKENGDEQKVTGFMSWEHKTAPTLILSTETGEAGMEWLRKHSRHGVHAQLPLNSAKNPRIASALRTTTGRAEFDSLRPGQADDDPSVERLTDGMAARCHPARQRVGPSGLCLQCAVEWYATHGKEKR